MELNRTVLGHWEEALRLAILLKADTESLASLILKLIELYRGVVARKLSRF